MLAHLCHIDGRVLGHIVWVLAQVVLWGVAWVLFEVLVTVWAHFCEIDGRVLGGMQVTAPAQFCQFCFGVWGC